MKSSDVSKPSLSQVLSRRKKGFEDFVQKNIFSLQDLEQLKKGFSFSEEEEKWIQSYLEQTSNPLPEVGFVGTVELEEAEEVEAEPLSQEEEEAVPPASKKKTKKKNEE